MPRHEKKSFDIHPSLKKPLNASQLNRKLERKVQRRGKTTGVSNPLWMGKFNRKYVYFRDVLRLVLIVYAYLKPFTKNFSVM